MDLFWRWLTAFLFDTCHSLFQHKFYSTVKDFSVKTEKALLLAEHLAWAVFQGGYSTWGRVGITGVAGAVITGVVDTPPLASLRKKVHVGTKSWLSGQAFLLPKAQLGKGAERNFNSPCVVSYSGFIFGILAYVSKFIKLMSTICRGRALCILGTEMFIFQTVLVKYNALDFTGPDLCWGSSVFSGLVPVTQVAS